MEMKDKNNDGLVSPSPRLTRVRTQIIDAIEGSGVFSLSLPTSLGLHDACTSAANTGREHTALTLTASRCTTRQRGIGMRMSFPGASLT